MHYPRGRRGTEDGPDLTDWLGSERKPEPHLADALLGLAEVAGKRDRLQERGTLNAAGKALAGQRERRVERVEDIEDFGDRFEPRIPGHPERLREREAFSWVSGAPRLQLM